MPMGSLEFGLLLMDAEWRKDARTEARLYQMMKTSAGHDDLHPGSRRNEIAKAAERERGPLRQNEIVKKDCVARVCGLGRFAVTAVRFLAVLKFELGVAGKGGRRGSLSAFASEIDHASHRSLWAQKPPGGSVRADFSVGCA
eukprot:s9588_g5.t2